MVNPFICGSNSFRHQLEKEDEDVYSQSSTPRKLSLKKSRKSSLSRIRSDKNPYAKRGLDKFSALLAEVEDKKQMIYTQIPSNEISLVCFTYSDKDTIKPMVVRARDKIQQNNIKNDENEKDKVVVDSKEASREKHQIESSTSIDKAKQGITNTMKKFFSIKIKIDFRKPSFYLPAIVILVLFFLAFFGKSFAILCTSIGWYLVPTIKKGSSHSKRENKKNEYTRKVGDKNSIVNEWLSSPNTVLTVAPANDVFSPRKGCRRRIW